jgi:hypothetical protein
MQCGMYAQFVVHRKDAARVSGAREKAFFGMPEAAQSLRMERVEIITDAAQKYTLRLRGKVAVFEGFSVFTAPVRLQIGSKTVLFTPDKSGMASADGASYRAINSGNFGVVFGGTMEWEATLPADPWLGELEKLGVVREGSPVKDASVELQMRIGEAQHTTTIREVQAGK